MLLKQGLVASSGITKQINKGVSINPEEISICKYKEILMAIVKDELEILSYGNSTRDLWHNR
ncbi:MAG TPA: hypothetical protein VKA87_00385 [Nitrososphaeraceae archaeon]|nr:hypothetical protein [Nitrososphaeraceae archaeon]